MNIEVLKLAKEYIRPIIKESSSKQWVMNGEDNQMYKDIIASYYGSPTNSAIIDSYARYVYGLGLNITQDFIDKSDLRSICFDMVLFGEACFEVTKEGKLFHIEKSKLLPSKAIDGEIESYWYSFDWSEITKNKPLEIPTLEYGKEGENRCYIIKSNQVGQFYFGNPSYISALPYCEVESELANYYINHIKNGMSFGHVINVNGGKPESEDDLNKFQKQIRRELTGSQNSGKFLLSFNDNKESETTISALEVSDAHKQYEFLTQEAQSKICISHKVVSGAILGITKSSGFSSNADEIETAFDETYLNVIKPIQESIIDALEIVKGLKNLDFISLRGKGENKQIESDKNIDAPSTIDAVTEDTIKKDASYNGAQISSSLDIMQAVKDGVLTVDQAITFLIQMLQFEPSVAKALFVGDSAEKITLSKENSLKKKDFKEYEADLIADELINLGEEINEDDWELVDDVKINGVPEMTEIQLRLARVPSSFPNVKSDQDTSLFKIRYTYGGNKEGQRDFCNKMISANKVYRKEDIDLASSKIVNKGFGVNGADTYDLWLYKGGVNCRHFWMRKVYLRKGNNSLSVNEAKKIIASLDTKDKADARWNTNDVLVSQPAQESNNFFKYK